MTESCFEVKTSVCATPEVLSENENPAKMTRPNAVAIPICRGFRSTREPILAHKPESFSSAWSNFGTLGQKIHRPRRTRAAGRKVSAANIAQAMPIDPTGPKPRLLERSERSKTIKPAITVPPEARIGSTVPRHAIAIA
ncbi:unannotated protein [freshwater metagenome]|uniref:Unannotated protein n=1 Tax=freshwater metagenome TaxID=449393 RepID=A0A6J6E2M1_9ZZZZ